MALVVIFCLGVANFAMHRAVLESRHPALGHIPWAANRTGAWFSLLVEFVMLLGAMLMSEQGAVGWMWGYAVYTLANGAGAWLILTGEV